MFREQVGVLCDPIKQCGIGKRLLELETRAGSTELILSMKGLDLILMGQGEPLKNFCV